MKSKLATKISLAAFLLLSPSDAINVDLIARHQLEAGVEKACLESQSCGNLSCEYSLERFLNPNSDWETHHLNRPYSDDTFPAASTSLYWKGFLGSDREYYNTAQQVSGWKRIRELEGGKPSLWGDKGVLPHGVNQGMLGDCWALGAASALAEYPARVKAIFDNEDASTEGIYRLNLYYRGQPVKVIVDDRLPVWNGNEPINAKKSRNNAWWYTIVEKAFAKMFVSYSNLSGGFSSEALRALTGMPVVTHPIGYVPNMYNDEKIWTIVKEADKAGYPMSGGIFKAKYGLTSGHAYSILDVYELKDGDSVKEKLVKVRNPWGVERYNGPWSDNSNMWTEEYEKQVDFKKGNDGVFFMPFSVFKQVFSMFGIAMYEPKWEMSSTLIRTERSNQQIRFSNPTR